MGGGGGDDGGGNDSDVLEQVMGPTSDTL